jgi:hypothetical protein
MKELRLKFKGNKEEILRQLKSWCALADETMNDKVVDLIEKFLEKQNKDN